MYYILIVLHGDVLHASVWINISCKNGSLFSWLVTAIASNHVFFNRLNRFVGLNRFWHGKINTVEGSSLNGAGSSISDANVSCMQVKRTTTTTRSISSVPTSDICSLTCNELQSYCIKFQVVLLSSTHYKLPVQNRSAAVKTLVLGKS